MYVFCRGCASTSPISGVSLSRAGARSSRSGRGPSPVTGLPGVADDERGRRLAGRRCRLVSGLVSGLGSRLACGPCERAASRAVLRWAGPMGREEPTHGRARPGELPVTSSTPPRTTDVDTAAHDRCRHRGALLSGRAPRRRRVFTRSGLPPSRVEATRCRRIRRSWLVPPAPWPRRPDRSCSAAPSAAATGRGALVARKASSSWASSALPGPRRRSRSRSGGGSGGVVRDPGLRRGSGSGPGSSVGLLGRFEVPGRGRGSPPFRSGTSRGESPAAFQRSRARESANRTRACSSARFEADRRPTDVWMDHLEADEPASRPDADGSPWAQLS